MLVCLLISNYMGGSINTMILGGLALVFSRLIDNGVIVLENIFRHMEMGESPAVAAENGGTEVSMAVLAATFTTPSCFFQSLFSAASASTSSLRWRWALCYRSSLRTFLL
jgi:multidrug efflux pump subunit AcrB